MTHGSLFSGIGGFELAAEWSGFTNVFSCEIEPFNQRVLKHYWPNSDLHTDVKEFPASDYTGRIDILTGGFPCQPYSVAGKRLGKEDDRHLWPYMLEIIREVAPTYVVGENVRGLVNWSDGLVFEEVCVDLEVAGYDVQPFILPAAGVGAPHRRDRVWFVAHASDKCRTARTNKRKECKPNNGSELWRNSSAISKERDASHTKRDGLEHGTERGSVEGSEGKARERVAGYVEATSWSRFPTQSPICGGDDGLPTELDGITFPKWRNESIKAYGNAIVPQLAYHIFQTIQQMHND